MQKQIQITNTKTAKKQRQRGIQAEFFKIYIFYDLEMLSLAVVIVNTLKLTLQADTKTHFTAVERLIEDESVLLHHLLSMVPKVIFLHHYTSLFTPLALHGTKGDL